MNAQEERAWFGAVLTSPPDIQTTILDKLDDGDPESPDVQRALVLLRKVLAEAGSPLGYAELGERWVAAAAGNGLAARFQPTPRVWFADAALAGRNVLSPAFTAEQLVGGGRWRAAMAAAYRLYNGRLLTEATDRAELLAAHLPHLHAAAGGSSVKSGLQRWIRSELAGLPQPEPLIAGTLDQGTVIVPYGYTGTLKSFIAQSWAASLATGEPWLGRRIMIDPRPVLYVAGEGLTGLDSRWRAWESWNAAIIPDELLSVLRKPVNIMRTAEVTALCRSIADWGIHTVVIDTLAKAMVGAEENSAKDMGIAVDALYEIREAAGPGGVVVAPHHTGRDRSTNRGSSALESGVDTMYLAEGDDRRVVLSRTKRKDGPKHDQLDVCLELVEGTGSGVLTKINSSGKGPDRPSAMWILSAFVRAFSADGASKSDFKEYAENSKGAPGKSAIYDGLNLLQDNGFLEKRTVKGHDRLYITTAGINAATEDTSGQSGRPSGP